MSTSMIYELIEWWAAVNFGGVLGVAFLGTLIAMLITAGLNYSLQRDFAREWVDSPRVKRPQPLGEDELRRLWLEKQQRGE